MNRFLVNDVGVPSNEIAGFRAPGLITNSSLWRAMERVGFTYDASLSEQLTVPRGVSRSLDSLVGPTHSRTEPGAPAWPRHVPTRRFPAFGAFRSGTTTIQVELISINGSGGRVRLPFSAQALNTCLRKDIRETVAPSGSISTQGNSGLPPARQSCVHSWKKKLKLPNVWMITMRGLIEWMRNPIPASALPQWFATGKSKGVGRIQPLLPLPYRSCCPPVESTIRTER